MKLLTKNIHDKLLANGRNQDEVRGTAEEIDFHPVVKLFTPDAGCTWLLTELDSQSPDIAFGQEVVAEEAVEEGEEDVEAADRAKPAEAEGASEGER